MAKTSNVPLTNEQRLRKAKDQLKRGAPRSVADRGMKEAILCVIKVVEDILADMGDGEIDVPISVLPVTVDLGDMGKADGVIVDAATKADKSGSA